MFTEILIACFEKEFNKILGQEFQEFSIALVKIIQKEEFSVFTPKKDFEQFKAAVFSTAQALYSELSWKSILPKLESVFDNAYHQSKAEKSK